MESVAKPTDHTILSVRKVRGGKEFIVCGECDEVVVPKFRQDGWEHLSERKK